MGSGALSGVREAAACGRGGGYEGERDLCTMWAEVRTGGAGLMWPYVDRSYWVQGLYAYRTQHAIVETTIAFDTPGYVETRAAEAAVGHDLT